MLLTKSDNKYTLAIPRTNLIQHLEKRFWTSGSTWEDQSGNGYNATINEQLGTLIYLIAHTVNFNLTLVKLLIG